MSDSLSGPARPLALTIGELADRLDLPARDTLDDVIDAGVRTFWHDGRKFDLETLREYLKRRHYFDPVPELDIELSASQVQWLAAMGDIDPAVLTGECSAQTRLDKPLRKFIPSQNELDAATTDRQSRTG